MKIMIDLIFNSIVNFSKKHRKGVDHIVSTILLMGFFFFMNLMEINIVLGLAFDLYIELESYYAFFIYSMIIILLLFYFYRKKRYIKIIKHYNENTPNLYVNYYVLLYIITTIVSIFVLAPLRGL